MNIMNKQVAVLVAGLGALALGGCASTTTESEDALASDAEAVSASLCPAGIPAAINPGADQSIKAVLNAVGVQVYLCGTTPANATPAWLFVNPQANLMNDSGRLLGTHFIGPTWQGLEGSSVVASKIAGATVDSTALPWLLLGATGHADPEGFFSDVTQIQRVSTVGGNAPTTGCDATTLGTVLQVPYSAEYVFYKTKTSGRVVQCKS